MLKIPTIKLVGIAGIGGMTLAVVGFGLKFKREADVRATQYYKESLLLFRRHRGVAQLMGEPIRDSKPELSNYTKNFCNGRKAHFEIPVKGTKKSGILYMWAARENGIDKWDIERLELSLNDMPGKRVVVLGKVKSEVK